MDVSSITFVSGLVIAVLSAVCTFFNRERYKTLVDIYQQGNDELRQQNSDLKAEKQECEKLVAEYKIKFEQQEIRNVELKELNSRQPDFASLTGLISTNHKQTISKLADLTKAVVDVMDKKEKR